MVAERARRLVTAWRGVSSASVAVFTERRTLMAVLVLIFAVMLYPFSDGLVKHLMKTYSLQQSMFLRAVARAIPPLVATFFCGGPIKVLSSKHPKIQLLRATTSVAQNIALMYAISMGALSVVYVATYMAPLILVLLAHFWLGENVRRSQIMAVLAGFAGLTIAARPGVGTLQLVSIISLSGAFFAALSKVAIRKMSATSEHPLSMTIYPNVMLCLVLLPFFKWQAVPWEHLWMFLLVGCLSATAQLLIVMAYRMTNAANLAPFEYASFIGAMFMDYFMWNKVVDVYTAIGASVIIGGNLYLMFHMKRSKSARSFAG